MNYSKILSQPRFQPPKGLKITFFKNQKGKNVRFAYLNCSNPKAVVIYHGGLGQSLESDFENMKSFNALGFAVYTLERYGENGSERPYDRKSTHFQKPPILPAYYFAQDLLNFVQTQITEKYLPVWFVGSCYGSLVGLTSTLIKDKVFDKMFFVAPMFGSCFMNKIGGELYLAGLNLSNVEKMTYYGKARDWDWSLAKKILNPDPTSSDTERGALLHLWRRKKPELRIGGYTWGRIQVTAASILDILNVDKLSMIATPTVIISPTLDTQNLIERHKLVATTLLNSELISIIGARHGLFREVDFYRNQLFSIFKQALV